MIPQPWTKRDQLLDRWIHRRVIGRRRAAIRSVYRCSCTAEVQSWDADVAAGYLNKSLPPSTMRSTSNTGPHYIDRAHDDIPVFTK